jgi:hypothetical protein
VENWVKSGYFFINDSLKSIRMCKKEEEKIYEKGDQDKIFQGEDLFGSF